MEEKRLGDVNLGPLSSSSGWYTTRRQSVACVWKMDAPLFPLLMRPRYARDTAELLVGMRKHLPTNTIGDDCH